MNKLLQVLWTANHVLMVLCNVCLDLKSSEVVVATAEYNLA